MTHLIEKQFLHRANAAMLLTLIGGGLLVSAFGAAVFDLGRIIGAW